MTKSLLLGMLPLVVTLAGDLPVRTVTLYKHGIGYFERSGELRSGAGGRLDFKASQMDDVLKSLTITEEGAGKITGLRYDSSEPLDRKLAAYPFRLGERLPLSTFLDQLKGARLDLWVANQQSAGAIVSGRSEAGGERQPPRELLVLLNDSGELQTVDLATVSRLKFQDASLGLQLKEYLEAVSSARSRDQKSVYIDSSDRQTRKIVASYVIPTAVWKSSYRLLFRENADPLLEGWAIVDNTTGEDWTNVNLSLVSGKPISFISRLYEPRYIDRPEAELPEQQARGPVLHEGAVAGRMKAAANVPMPPPAPAVRAAFALNALEMRREERTSTIAPATQARELGDLFEYRFQTPVTVKRNESAMLPFLQQRLSARKLLIYSDASWQNPMTAAELTNSTGKTLDGGPITVFDNNAYAGEALVATFKAGDKRLISYGVDLGTRITTKLDRESELVREIRLRRGVLTTRAALQETKTYTIQNVDAKAKTLVIEHPIREAFKLLHMKPSETTSSAYRFEVKLPASGAEKFAVSEENLYENSLAVVNLTPDVLGTYAQNKALSAAGRQQLERIAVAKRAIAACDTELKRLETSAREITKDQERIRENINSLNRVSGQQEQVQRYARELAAQETQLASLRDQTAEQRKRKSALESDLNNLIEKLEF